MKKTAKRTLSALLSAIMLLSIFTASLTAQSFVSAAETTQSEQSEFTYTVSENKAAITGYTGSENEIAIPETIDGYTVTAIDEFAFFMNTVLTGITIPSTVEVIDDYAFFHCTSLSELNLPADGTLTIGTSAFEGCINLLEVTLPDITLSVGERAFLNCSNLLTVNGGKTLDSIGAYAFGYLRETTNWNYVRNYVNLKGYSSTALEDYGYDNGLIFTSLGEGTPAPEKNTQNPEEDLDIPVIEFTDYNNYSDDDPSTLNIRDVIGNNTKDYTANASAVYTDPETGLSFNVYANLKLQGNSSMSYPKKNFTIKLYKDETFDSKYKVELQDGWGKENKYVLKANYMDHSHSRNVVGAKLWGQIVNSRETTYQQLLDSPNGGAIDGYPVKVYINGTYEGLYTLNIPKDDWQFAMGDGTQEALLAGESHEGSCKFDQPGRYDESDWTIEYPDPEEEDVSWVKTSFNEVIGFVTYSSDEEFKNLFSDYLDYDSCIDYYVYMLFICGTDNWEKNMLMATYDGTQWFPSVYDMDSTFGIYWDGGHYNTIDWMLTHEYVGADHGTKSLLWDRVADIFADDIKARYAELRETVLSEKNFIKTINDFIGDIPKEVFDRDLSVYGGIPSSSTSDPNQMINYTLERLKYLDQQMGYAQTLPENPIRTQLEEKVASALEIDTASYTDITASFFLQELENAQNVLNNLTATNVQLETAGSKLDQSVNALIQKPDSDIQKDLALIPQSELTAYAPCYHPNEDGSKAIDGNTVTMWHTYWNSGEGTMPVISEDGTNNYITITLGEAASVAAITYIPRTDANNNGDITGYKLQYSTEEEGENFVDVPGGTGSWNGEKGEKICIFSAPVYAKRIRLYATTTLGATANAYVSAAEINLYQTDKTALGSLIDSANSLVPSDYTADSYEKVAEALVSAKAAYEDEAVYQTTINDSAAALSGAIQQLVPAEETPEADKTQLKALIESASQIDASCYTKASAEALASAIAAAQKIYETEGLTQEEINAACESLEAAVSGLKYYPGDVNHSGTITVIDATMIQLYLAKINADESFDTASADANGDGNINIEDVTIVQKIAAKLISVNDDGSLNI